MSEKIEVILDACVDRIVSGDATVEQCLEAYPERAEELEPLLWAAIGASAGFALEPRAEFQRMAKSRFMNSVAAMREGRVKRGWLLSGVRRNWALVVAVMLAVLVMSGGTVGASTNSLPGEVLYPVKRAAENVQSFFTFGREAKASLYMKFAERRVAEIEKLSGRNRDVPAGVLGVMNTHTIRALDLAGENGSFKPEVIGRLVKLTADQRTVLKRIVEKAPAAVRLRLRDAMQNSEAAHQRALVISDRMMVPGDRQQPPSGGNRMPSEQESVPSAESAAPAMGAGDKEPALTDANGSGAEVEPGPGHRSTAGEIEEERWRESEVGEPENGEEEPDAAEASLGDVVEEPGYLP
jgi:hypothetical protein